MRGLICPRFLRPSGDELAAIAELRMRETMKGDPASRMKENARPIVNADRCPNAAHSRSAEQCCDTGLNRASHPGHPCSKWPGPAYRRLSRAAGDRFDRLRRGRGPTKGERS